MSKEASYMYGNATFGAKEDLEANMLVFLMSKLSSIMPYTVSKQPPPPIPLVPGNLVTCSSCKPHFFFFTKLSINLQASVQGYSLYGDLCFAFPCPCKKESPPTLLY